MLQSRKSQEIFFTGPIALFIMKRICEDVTVRNRPTRKFKNIPCIYGHLIGLNTQHTCTMLLSERRSYQIMHSWRKLRNTQKVRSYLATKTTLLQQNNSLHLAGVK
ncbi:PREDICTED: uncharacterized protein LOC109184065 [Ipomoea nil]|uniref:uncharacterized protein LOC109184065 n=1 Tax=Ipomoea nil TaxID=35883 RepID=UPI0009009893|nr:PREDICTED: uncharacterized protein LOC109184065 [Ipomoea nil]